MSYLNFDFDIDDFIASDSFDWCGGNWNGCNNCGCNSNQYGYYNNCGLGSCCNSCNSCNCGCGCSGAIGCTLSSGICSQTLNNTVIDGSVNSRIVIVPVTIQNLVNNKDFIVWVTVYQNTICGPVVVGQDYATVCNSGAPGCSDYTFEMPIAINVPICNSANISVCVNGNYVCVC